MHPGRPFRGNIFRQSVEARAFAEQIAQMRKGRFRARPGEFYDAGFDNDAAGAPSHAEHRTPAVRALQARRNLRPAAAR